MRRRKLLWLLILPLVFVAGSLACGVVYQTLVAARASAARQQCSGLFCQINIALLNYHQEHGCLPPAYIVGPDGKPMHSWRVLVLKYFEPEIYDAYDFREPWNGPNNSRLAKSSVAGLFRCPAASPNSSVYTNYVAIVGAQTAFPGAESTCLEQIPDGRSPDVRDTILVVEIANSDIQWMEPRDLRFEQMSFRINDSSHPSISSNHPDGANLATRGACSGQWFPETTSPDLVRNLLRIKER